MTLAAAIGKMVREQRDYLKRLKHRAKVRGGPDTSAMGLADEAESRLREWHGILVDAIRGIAP